MSFKLNHLEIQPDYDAHKDFRISVGKNMDYQTIQGGFPLAQVRNVNPDRVSISFPLARETASAGITLQNQVRELVKNPEVGEVYLNWSGATHLNGYYALDSADIEIPTGGIDGGYADFNARLTKIGERERVQRAIQLNHSIRTSDYGTNLTGTITSHGFPFAASVYLTSGSLGNRGGSLGDIEWTRNVTNQDLFPYEQDVGSIGLGDVRVYDDMGDAATRANWVEVFGADHKFTGDAVLENTLLQVLTRKTFTADLPGGLTLKYWNKADSDYAVAGTASFVEIDGVNYGTTVPKINLNNLSAERAELVLSYPPSANSLKVKARLDRGQWDIEARPSFVTGTIPTNLVGRLDVGTFNSNILADATDSAAKADGTYSIATLSANRLSVEDSGRPSFGMVKLGTRTFNDTYNITSSKADQINMATGTAHFSFFAIGSSGDSSDSPATMAGHIRSETQALGQVVER